MHDKEKKTDENYIYESRLAGVIIIVVVVKVLLPQTIALLLQTVVLGSVCCDGANGNPVVSCRL